MIISVDVDGVLADWEGRARALLQDEFGLSLPVSTSWDAIKEAVSEEQWGWLWRDPALIHLFKDTPLLPGARGALQWLQDEGHHVAISTCVPPSARIYRLQWFEQHALPHSSMHFIDKLENKWVVGADVYVDDSPQVLSSLLRAAQGCSGVVGVMQPWNEAFRASDEGQAVRWVDCIRCLPYLVDYMLEGR